jgi:hypothetical protein
MDFIERNSDNIQSREQIFRRSQGKEEGTDNF